MFSSIYHHHIPINKIMQYKWQNLGYVQLIFKFHINLVEGKIRVNINKKNAVSYSKLENIPSSVYKSQTVYIFICSLWYKSEFCTACHQVCIYPTQMARHTVCEDHAMNQRRNLLLILSLKKLTVAHSAVMQQAKMSEKCLRFLIT